MGHTRKQEKKRPSSKSVSTVITEFLRTKGTEGATLQEVYTAAQAELGEKTPHSSIRCMLYKRLIGTDSKYLSAFERFAVGSQTRYRLTSGSE
jgi:hypothetical protein